MKFNAVLLAVASLAIAKPIPEPKAQADGKVASR